MDTLDKERSKMKIAFVSRDDVSDIRTWSGTNYHLFHALKSAGEKKDVALCVIDKLDDKRNIMLKLYTKIYAVILKVLKRPLGGRYYKWNAKFFARQIKKELPDDVDVIFSMTQWPVAYLKSDKIKIFFSDAEIGDFFDMCHLYQEFSLHWKQTAIKLQENAINNSDLILFSSEWAANGIMNRYGGIDKKKIKIVPIGANIKCTRAKNDIAKIIEKKSGNMCFLLFIGRSWKGKGGNIALETAKILHKSGMKVHLDIVGIKDCPTELPEYVKNHGFILKSEKDGLAKLDALFKKAHFFILPTRADTFGIVYAEASSYGLPSLATKIGGVSGVVADGKNGKLFDFFDNGEKYAEYIQTMLSDYEKYKKLCFSSFEQYETRFNWKIIGEKIIEHIMEIRK